MKPLEAKVQIYRLAKLYREISDIPYKSETEIQKESEILDEIRTIVSKIIFKNEVDRDDFKEFLDTQLYGDMNIDLPNPEGEKIHDEQITEELDATRKFKAIPQIQRLRERKKHVEEELQELQKRKKDLEMLKKKENLKKQVEKMEQEIADQQREEAYFTDKKDKEGLVKLRKEKYNKRMDELKLEEYELKELLEKTKDDDEIKIIKEALKLNSSKKNKLRMIKTQTYFQNAMVKIPRWINKGTSAVGELADGLGKMGGDLGKMDNTGDDFGDFKIGDDPFDLSGGKKKTSSKKSTSKKSKKKSKRTKKKSKKKKQSNNNSVFSERSWLDY